MSNWKDLKNNPRLKKIYDTRLVIIRLTREWFWSLKFSEVETPIALKYAGQEPYLNPVPVEFCHPNGKKEKFFLQTSPEFGMKKLLGAGYEKIFQLCKCFRNFEDWGDGTHNTEFLMLEFYRAPGSFLDIENDIESLFKFIGKKLGIEKFGECNIFDSWDRITMKELWQQELGIDLDKNLTIEEISDTARNMGFFVGASDSYEDIFYQIFLNKIESNLGKSKPVFVYDYPAQMCSLSKICKNNEKYAERFELYINGLELANGFGELTDSIKQAQALELDLEKRKSFGKEIWAVDNDFIDALASLDERLAQKNDESKNGAGGVALGMDRMVLLFSQVRGLNEVIFETVSDQTQF